MNAEKNVPRLLGASFVIVAVASLISGLLLMSVIGSRSISDSLVNVSQQMTLMRLSSLSELVTSSGIVVLAGLLYLVLHTQNKIIALVALGWWLAEAIFLAISQLGVLALLPVSLDARASGSSGPFLLSNVGRIAV